MCGLGLGVDAASVTTGAVMRPSEARQRGTMIKRTAQTRGGLPPAIVGKNERLARMLMNVVERLPPSSSGVLDRRRISYFDDVR